MAQNPQAKYLESKIMTASKEQLVVMLYDGLLRFCQVAVEALEKRDLERAHKALIRCQDIVMELTYSLNRDKGGDVAKNLASLYNYGYRLLVEANIKHDPTILKTVDEIFRKLRDAWAEALTKVEISGESSDGASYDNSPLAMSANFEPKAEPIVQKAEADVPAAAVAQTRAVPAAQEKEDEPVAAASAPATAPAPKAPTRHVLVNPILAAAKKMQSFQLPVASRLSVQG